MPESGDDLSFDMRSLLRALEQTLKQNLFEAGGEGVSWHLQRSAAVPSRSSTDFAALPDCAQTQTPADMLRLGTAAFRPGPVG